MEAQAKPKPPPAPGGPGCGFRVGFDVGPGSDSLALAILKTLIPKPKSEEAGGRRGEAWGEGITHILTDMIQCRHC